MGDNPPDAERATAWSGLGYSRSGKGHLMDRAQERRLIRRAAAGDKQAAEACIRAHQQSLYAYMLRLSAGPTWPRTSCRRRSSAC